MGGALGSGGPIGGGQWAQSVASAAERRAHRSVGSAVTAPSRACEALVDLLVAVPMAAAGWRERQPTWRARLWIAIWRRALREAAATSENIGMA